MYLKWTDSLASRRARDSAHGVMNGRLIEAISHPIL